MTDRVVKVSLQATVSNYIANMEAASKSTKKVEQTLEAQKAASIEAARKQGEAAATLGRGVMAFGAVAAAGVAIAIAKFSEFDAAMSEVQASTHETEANMHRLRDAAMDAGGRTVFSATEAANAIDELAKAGLSTADILGGALDGALSLASAGGLDVADAASIAATALTQFKLKGEDVPHVADLLAAGAGKAQGSVEDLSQALNQGGLVASQAGFSIEETTGVLAAFASAGLKGSDAGTSLKTAIIALQAPSQKAQATMDQYGISVYDSNGKMKSFSEIAEVLKSKLGGLTDAQRNSALATIFGTDAVRSASVLYSNGGKGIDEWNKKVNDSGYAAETARLKLDNLKGDLEQLGGAIDTGLIQSGSGANDVLRGLVQGVTGFANGIGSLPAPLLATGLGITAVVAATALMGGGFLSVVPKVAAAKVALSDLNVSGKTLAAGFGKGGAVLAALTLFSVGIAGAGSTAELTTDQLAKLNAATKAGGLADLNKQFKSTDERAINASAGVSGFRDALDALTSSDFSKNLQGNKNVGGFFDSITFGAANVSGELKKFEAQFKQMGTTLASTASEDFPSAVEQFNKYVKAAGGGKEATKQLLEAMPDYGAALRDLAGDQGKTLTEQELLNLATGKGALAQELSRDAAAKSASAIAELGGAAEDAKGDVSKLAEAIEGFGKAQFDVNSTQRDFQASIDEATASLEKNGVTLDINSEAGRANQASLDAIAQSALTAAGAILTQTGSQEDATAAVQSGRDALIAALGQFGITGQAAEDYANKLGLIPRDIASALRVVGADSALAEVARVNAALASVQRAVDIAVRINGAQNLATTGGLKVGFASGGYTGDAPTGAAVGVVHGKEWVSKASTVAIPENRRALEYMHAGGVIRGYASGGFVQPQYARPSYGGSGGGSSVPAAIYVQNPFTGDYLLAKTADVAAGVVEQNNAAFSRATTNGRRVR